MRHIADILLVCGLLADSEEASELYVDEVLDGSGRLQYVDSTGSVRGLRRDEARYIRLREQLDEYFSEGDPHGT